MDKAAVFSVIFPKNIPYFSAFLDSLTAQTEKNFDLILLVDDVPAIESYLTKYRDKLTIKLKHFSGSIADIRQHGLEWLTQLTYEHIVFADTDDLLSPDRVAVCRHYLEVHPVVVNDLSPFTDIANLSDVGYWQKRMAHEQIFSSHHIERFNFVGLGNTAVHRRVLKTEIFSKNLHVVDWFLFYHWLQNRTGIFVHTGKICYRQHTDNLAGIRTLTKERLFYIFETKIQHYNMLVPAFGTLENPLRQTIKTRARIEQNIFLLEDELQKLNARQINYFWWEETEYLYE